MGGRSTCRKAVYAAALLLSAGSARAEDRNRLAAATLLFDEGVRALDAGRLEEACAKLAKSQDLAPSGGTLLALGECHERAGRAASAWVAFRGAASRAAAAGKTDAEASALDHAAKLEPKLARLTIKLASPPANLELFRDGSVITTSELDVAMPVDPGKHAIRASAPGLRAWRGTVQLGPAAQVTLEVPPLEPSMPERPTNDDPGAPQRTLGLVTGGVGAGVLVAGVIFGLLARSANDRGEANCKGQVCTRQGIDDLTDASTKATVSTVFFVVGAAMLASGAGVYLTAPKPRQGAFLDWPSAALRW